MKLSTSRFVINAISSYIPFVRRIPLEINKKIDHASEVANRISKELVEEKYREAENKKLNKKDLLSLLININKTLPIEERMTDDELRYQVIKNKRCNIKNYSLIYTRCTLY